MAEFQGSFLSFINSDPKENKSHRNPVPEPRPNPVVIDLDDDSGSNAEPEPEEDEHQIIDSELIEETDIEKASSDGPQSVVMESVRKLVDSREEIFKRLESELEQLTQACQEDYLFQITDEEYDSLFRHTTDYLAQLRQQIRSWCNKNLQVYRVCKECGFKVLTAKGIRDHLKGNGSCISFYFALGTVAFPPNSLQCRECSYSSNNVFNMRRHQHAKGHVGILHLGGSAVEENEEQQQAEVEEEVAEEVEQEEVEEVQILVEEPEEVIPVEATGSTGQNDILNDMSMWPKDDDSGGLISNLQCRLEQQVENSDDHFIFRISNEEYAALNERRAYHMAKFGELVNIYCNKTLKLYQVCDGCGFATFLRKDMITHFETGTCILSYFNALGTCDDDDPNKDAVEEEAEQITPIEDQFQITEVEATEIECEPASPPKPETNSRKQCPQCSKTFQTAVRLKNHIRIVHTAGGLIEYKCESCLRQFKFDYLLQKHTRKGCPVAKKELPTVAKGAKKERKAAQAAQTSSKKIRPCPIQCKDCSVFFVSMVDLYRHQKSFCRARHGWTVPLVTVIKVEPTRLGGGLGQG
uniref:C2H2-type domain-containing protein n=1 Tax=Culex tarsalis TaxID=7177 RepID=A0A1Q3F5H3_CULTA